MILPKTIIAIVLATPALADIIVDMYPNDDCSGTAKSTSIDPGSEQFTCVSIPAGAGNSIQISADGSTSLESCGPFYTDDSCQDIVMGSEPFDCSMCIATAAASVQIEQEL